MNHPNTSKLGKFQRILTVFSLVVSLSSSQVKAVQAAEVTSTALFSQTNATSSNDDHTANTGFVIPNANTKNPDLPQMINGLTSLINVEPFTIPERAPTLKTYKMDVTAYTSTLEECDSDPFVTADGSLVADGIVATNILPFGTKIRIPKYFGERIFTVHDRMNARYSARTDIWMSSKTDMRNWGLKRNVDIEVVEWGDGKTQWAGWTKKRLADASKLVAEQLKNVD